MRSLPRRGSHREAAETLVEAYRACRERGLDGPFLDGLLRAAATHEVRAEHCDWSADLTDKGSKYLPVCSILRTSGGSDCIVGRSPVGVACPFGPLRAAIVAG